MRDRLLWIFCIITLTTAHKGPDIATKLYPHQKKALTFLLEREHELDLTSSGKTSSLWQPRTHAATRSKSWVNLVTQQEVYQEPREARGSLLADDVCYHRSCRTDNKL